MKLQDIRWKRNIFNSIEDISKIEWQKKVWLGKDLRYVSSYDEIIMVLFDDFCFDDFISNDVFERLKLNKDLQKEMIQLKNMIDNYKRKVSEEEILNDPEWHKIVEQAQKIIQNDLQTVK